MYNDQQQREVANKAVVAGQAGITTGSFLRHALSLSDPASGRSMAVYATNPGLQVYTANGMEGEPPFQQYYSVALELQHFPDSINHASFPSIVIRPGTTLPGTPQYFQQTVFEFSNS